MTDESISIDTGTDELLCAIRDRVTDYPVIAGAAR